MKTEIGTLESLVDAHFDANPVLSLPFGVLFNFMSEIATARLIEEGNIDVNFLIPLMFIFERDLDLTPLSLEVCRDGFDEIAALHPAAMDLMKCANLNIVFPFIHSGVYTYKRLDKHTSLVDYTSADACRAELVDSVLSNLSIPIIPPVKVDGVQDHWISVKRRLERREVPNVLKSTAYIEKIYEAISNSYREAVLVPDTFYSNLGFTDASAFRKIRQALCAICYAYMQTAIAVSRYCKGRQLGDDVEFALRKGLSMAVEPKSSIRNITLKLTGAKESDFNKFGEFFFENGSTRSSISKRFLPPFWDLGDCFYFCPGAAFMSMSVRNLLITVQNHPPFSEKYHFHEQISDLFEPMLLERAKHHFETNGYAVVLEKKIPGTDIDLLAYCAKSNTLLTVQAKATLYPEGARMVRNLDGRINEGIEQLGKFDRLSQKERIRIINDCFPGAGEKEPQHMRGILTNSSFGTYKSWEQMERKEIIPINCNILRHVLPQCADLTELPKQTKNYIDSCLALVNFEIKDKTFEIGDQKILQKNLDFDIRKLYEKGLMSE
jgi:hypothetical protein